MGVPGRIGDIQPFAELSRNSAATVYKGYQLSLQRVVLLKVLRPELASDRDVAQRFEEEAHLVAAIQHPNVVTIYDYGRSEGLVYLVAEYVEGMDLQALVERSGRLPLELVTFILLEAARGLQAAHQEQIIHRDVKPANILISQQGRVKITDFGMASLGAADDTAHEVRGTPGYLAPEQIVRDETSAASDLFALGATAYDMVAGRMAFPGETTDERINATLNRDPLSGLNLTRAVPDPLHRVLKKLLAKAPDRRYQTASVLIEELREFRSEHGILAGAAQVKRYLDDQEAYTPRVTDAELCTAPAGRGTSAAEGETPGIPPIPAFPELVRMLRSRGVAIGVGVAILVLLGYASKNMIADRGRDRIPQTQRSLPVVPYSSGGQLLGPMGVGPFDTLQGPVMGGSRSYSGRAVDEREERPLHEAAPDSGMLTITVDEDSARVYLGGDSIGTTPLPDALRVAAGSYSLEVRHPDFPAYRDSVVVGPDTSTALAVSLRQQVGQIHVRVSPWAEVYIDGVLQDTIPFRKRPFLLTPGEVHTLTLVHPPQNIRRDTTVLVEAGEVRELEFVLDTNEE